MPRVTRKVKAGLESMRYCPDMKIFGKDWHILKGACRYSAIASTPTHCFSHVKSGLVRDLQRISEWGKVSRGGQSPFMAVVSLD